MKPSDLEHKKNEWQWKDEVLSMNLNWAYGMC